MTPRMKPELSIKMASSAYWISAYSYIFNSEDGVEHLHLQKKPRSCRLRTWGHNLVLSDDEKSRSEFNNFPRDGMERIVVV